MAAFPCSSAVTLSAGSALPWFALGVLSCSCGRPSTLWAQSSGTARSPCGTGALGAGEGGSVHRKLQGSRAVPGQWGIPPWAEGRGVGAPGRSRGGHSPGAPVLPGKGLNDLRGAQGLSATSAPAPRGRPCSAALHTWCLYRMGQQQGGAGPQSCPRAAPAPALPQAQTLQPTAAPQGCPQAPRASISKGLQILCQCLEHFCKIIYGRWFWFFSIMNLTFF